ncbi:6261_t:CDS:2, partial [Racocetra persica]
QPSHIMDADYVHPNRGASLRRNKTFTRPERYQPAAPLLTGKKERKPFDLWVLFSRIVTFWAPNILLSKCGGFPDKQSSQAWREKVALCFIALVMGAIVAFLTVGFRPVLCPAESAKNSEHFLHYNANPNHLGILGWQFDITSARPPSGFDIFGKANQKNGQDITNFFKRDNSDIASCQLSSIQKFAAVAQPLCSNSSSCPLDKLSLSTLQQYNLKNTSKRVGFDYGDLGSPELKNYFVIDGYVLNLDPYISAKPKPDENDLLDKMIRSVLNSKDPSNGKDVTKLIFGKDSTKQAMTCLIQKYYAGNIDKQTIGCFTSDVFNYIMLVVILGVVMVRFFMACVFNWFISYRLAHEPIEPKKQKLQPVSQSFGRRTTPWIHRNTSSITATKTMNLDKIGNDLFTVLLVTCYSEGEEGLRLTCESMAATDYPDDRKLLFLICDGIITGSGNDK